MIYVMKLLTGGSIYCILELLARGHTHWTMFILGGLCYAGCGFIYDISGPETAVWQQMILCTIIITVLEFITGLIVNILLGWNVWDYHKIPLNILGQICVPYMLLWFILSFPALMLNRYI